MNQQVDETHSSCDSQLMKQHLESMSINHYDDETPGSWNTKLMKQQIDEKESWWNNLLIK